MQVVWVYPAHAVRFNVDRGLAVDRTAHVAGVAASLEENDAFVVDHEHVARGDEGVGLGDLGVVVVLGPAHGGCYSCVSGASGRVVVHTASKLSPLPLEPLPVVCLLLEESGCVLVQSLG